MAIRFKLSSDSILVGATVEEIFSAPSFEFHNAAIESETASGRKFRYEIDEHFRHLQADTRPEKTRELAEVAARGKFRYSPWDKAHPSVNSEAEICERLCLIFVQRVEALKRAARRGAEQRNKNRK